MRHSFKLPPFHNDEQTRQPPMVVFKRAKRWTVISSPAGVAATALAVVACVAGCGGASSSAVEVGQHDAAKPPPRQAARDSVMALCPNPDGLERFTGTSVGAARRVAARYGDASRAADLAVSDRAWWPQVKRDWARRHSALGHFAVVAYEPAADNRAASAMIARACGKSLVEFTEIVAVRPKRGARRCNACGSELFFVQRRRRPLIYFIR